MSKKSKHHRQLFTIQEKCKAIYRKLRFDFVNTAFSFFCVTCINIFKVLIALISRPIGTFFVVLMQLILGALLGAQFGNALSSKTSETDSPDFLQLLQTLWSDLIPGVQYFAIGVVIVSLVKASADAMQSFLERRQEKVRREQEHLVPSGQHFMKSYVDTVRSVLDKRYLIDSNNTKPLDVVEHSLTRVRELAAKYEDAATDTISINLMLAMRTDESQERIEKSWDKIHMFFDGASPEAACAQIDGVLVPIAVAHKNVTKLYIGGKHQQVKPLLLPIIDEESSTKTQQRVIGAPKAFSSGHPEYCPNFLSSVDYWLFKEQKRFINREQAESLYKYYVDDSSARSLLSIPIRAQYQKVNEKGEKIEDRPTILVLNIYARHENLLRGNPSVFLGLVQPLIDTISYATERWMVDVEANANDETEAETDTEAHSKLCI